MERTACSLLAAALTIYASFAACSCRAQVLAPVSKAASKHALQSPARYINLLSIEDSQHIGDPYVLRFDGSYYLYLSGGRVWSSTDLVHWTHHSVRLPAGKEPEAPAAFVFDGYIYVTNNDIGLLRSRTPLGPYEYISDFKDERGKPQKLFDPMIFQDSDGRVYLYFSSRAAHGIYGVELDRADLTRFLSSPTHFFSFNSSHLWERSGARNNYSNVSWLEAPWMTKRNVTYYLQYFASGTDWNTYAVGVYTAKHPLGPFTYDPKSPILSSRHGLIEGTGHHCIVQAKDGSVWALYTVLYRNWNRHEGLGRRIGMDPVGFDAQGHMYVQGPSETPQWAPGVKAEPWIENNSASIPLSIDASYQVSSEGRGRNAPYAFDNNVRTWWEPAETDATPSITLDLGDKTSEDAEQQYTTDATRILFLHRAAGTSPYLYTIEVSRDGKSYRMVVDQSANGSFNSVAYDEIEPTEGRFVRITFRGWLPNEPLEVAEFTVFGKPIEHVVK